MDFKNKLIGLTVFIMIFISYNYLQPMGSGFNEISKDGYTLQTHEINKDNDGSHPAER